MKNIVHRNLRALITQAEDCADGAAQYGAALQISLNTEAKVRLDINNLLDDIDAYEQARVAMNNLEEMVRNETGNAKQFLTLTREVLRPHFTKAYTQAWDVTGFVGSLAIPLKPADVQALVQALQRFLAANPTLENAALNVTAAHAMAVYDALSEARADLAAQVVLVKNLFASRNEKALQLRKRVSGFIAELKQLMGALDARWLAFGLNMPGAKERPETPLNLAAVLVGPNAASLTWDSAARAEYYRVWMKVIGVDEELLPVGSPADLDFTLEALPSNKLIEVAISAINNGGESPVSNVITITTS